MVMKLFRGGEISAEPVEFGEDLERTPCGDNRESNRSGDIRTLTGHSRHLHPLPFLSRRGTQTIISASQTGQCAKCTFRCPDGYTVHSLALHRNSNPIVQGALVIKRGCNECCTCRLLVALDPCFPLHVGPQQSTCISQRKMEKHNVQGQSGPQRSVELPQNTRAQEHFTSPLEIPLHSLPHWFPGTRSNKSAHSA